MNTSSIRKLVTAALFAALACMATLVIQLHISPSGGFVNLGDCVVLICGWVLSPVYGMAAAGIGSMMADVIAGYPIYAPATLVIKALMALAAGGLFRFLTVKLQRSQIAACILSAVLGEAIMAAGYCFYEFVILGLGPAALLGLPGSGVQAFCGGVSAVVVYLLLRRNKTLSDHLDQLQ